ncbi:hypothetical protein FHR72_002216 [Mycolicibacterium iranicum]|uniref:Uncharacterized protein n=1 Tax=Mycolicibacterium iranicum TaxID=912594 RepID=A0A839Q5I2_MYCIR|nr:hypothetical protein [Mycolicibacterium iranicum]MBB2990743.1 hypothetical protein [Mycolicibacterium iranicum]
MFAAAAAFTGLTACSGPSEPADETSPTSAVPSVGHGSFAYCLGQHGVPAPPGPAADPPPGIDPEVWETAMAECSTLAPGPAG